jgi:hypothetical protein
MISKKNDIADLCSTVCSQFYQTPFDHIPAFLLHKFLL